MGIVYRNKHEIKIPDGLLINHNDGRVYSLKRNLESKITRTVFGYATSETTMHVNNTFKSIYPDLWREYYGDEELRPYNLRCGLYALTLGIGHKTGLYPAVQKCFGPQHGNAIMDYCMYSFLTRTDVTQIYEDTMADEVLFSDRLYSDAWYSNLFSSGITKDQAHLFKIQWIAECKRQGVKKIWLSIDGSNNNCQVQNSDLCEYGNGKKNEHLTLVSYIYAVDAHTGKPVTWFVNAGGMVDCKAFDEICSFLADNQLEIEGVIIDRGFVSKAVLEKILKLKLQYILMLHGDTYGHTVMFNRHASKIRWKVEYAVSPKGIFGITEEERVFRNWEQKAWINLYFDGTNGSERAVALMDKIMNSRNEIQQKISRGEEGKIPAHLKNYLSITEYEGKMQLVCHYDKWQADMDAKGYYSIASSLNLGAEAVYGIYHLRDASETQYMIQKSMEGFDVTRVHSTASVESKLAVCFIGSAIRFEMMDVCRKSNLNTNQMIREINRIKLQLRNDQAYYAIMNHSERQKDILGQFDIFPESFEQLALDVTRRRMSKINTQEHMMPSTIVPFKNRRGRPAMPKDMTVEKRRPGRPGGKTAEVIETTPSRGRGRPKGSRNRRTLEKIAGGEYLKPKRPRGRPAGSLNKKTIAKEKAAISVSKRGRGRPAGSLNKKTIERLKLGKK